MMFTFFQILATAHRPHLDDATTDPQRSDVAIDVLATDHVEDHIDPVSSRRRQRLLDEVLDRVVDDDVGSERATGRDLPGRGRDDATRSDGVTDPDRCGTDTRRARVDQCGAPRGEATLHDECVERRDPHLGDGGRVDDGDSRRHGEDLVRVHHESLGIGTPADDPHHRIADRPLRHPIATGGDPAGELHAGDLRGGRDEPGERWARIEAESLQQIGAVERCRGHVDQHLLGTGNGFGDVDESEHPDVAVLGEDDSSHDTSVRSQSMTTETVHHRSCPLCEASCGLELTVRDDTVALVRGDRDNAFSNGYLCPKGASIGKLHHDPDRLRMPLVREGDDPATATWREVSWDEAWQVVTDGLRPIIDEHGRDAVAVYLGNPSVHSLGPVLFNGPLVKALGSRNVF